MDMDPPALPIPLEDDAVAAVLQRLEELVADAAPSEGFDGGRRELAPVVDDGEDTRSSGSCWRLVSSRRTTTSGTCVWMARKSPPASTLCNWRSSPDPMSRPPTRLTCCHKAWSCWLEACEHSSTTMIAPGRSRIWPVVRRETSIARE